MLIPLNYNLRADLEVLVVTVPSVTSTPARDELYEVNGVKAFYSRHISPEGMSFRVGHPMGIKTRLTAEEAEMEMIDHGINPAVVKAFIAGEESLG